MSSQIRMFPQVSLSMRPLTSMKTLRIVVAVIAVFSLSYVSAKDKESECENPNPVKIVTEQELSSKVGTKESGDIWISIMGEVYDVSSGRQFYAEGSSYSVFAGKDASVSFITGVFTDEEAKKSLLHDSISAAQLVSLEEWRKFYESNKDYPFVGLLEGRLYDKEGNPTEEMKSVKEKIAGFVPPEKKKRPTATES